VTAGKSLRELIEPAPEIKAITEPRPAAQTRRVEKARARLEKARRDYDKLAAASAPAEP
jgi:hypothetical protein